MNYPKPEIFDPTPQAAPTYNYVPEYRFEIQKTEAFAEYFEGIDGFDTFEDADEIDDQAAQPFKTVINNSSDEWVEANLFNSLQNRLSSNFGNPIPITIASSDQSANYAAQLAQTENQVSEIGMVRVNLFRKPENIGFIQAFSRMSLQYEGQNPNGIPVAYRFNPIIDERQFNLSVFEYRSLPSGLLLNAFSGFRLMMPPNSAIEIEIITSAQSRGLLQRIRATRESRMQERRDAKRQMREAKMNAKLARANRRADPGN